MNKFKTCLLFFFTNEDEDKLNKSIRMIISYNKQ